MLWGGGCREIEGKGAQVKKLAEDVSSNLENI